MTSAFADVTDCDFGGQHDGFDVPALGVRSVALPDADMMNVNGITYFAIDVVPDNGETPRRIMKRYSELRQFALLYGEAMQALDVDCTFVEFPRKTFTTCAGDRLESRRHKLELWFGNLLQQQEIHFQMRPLLRKFLQADEPAPLPQSSNPPVVTL